MAPERQHASARSDPSARDDVSARDAAEREAWAVLGGVDGIGPATLVGVVERVGGARQLVELAASKGRRELETILRESGQADADGRDEILERAFAGDLLDRLCAAARGRDAFIERLLRLRLVAVTLDEPTYPERLRAIDAPPVVLFVRGDVRALSAPRAIAVVGTRRPSGSGRLIAGRIAGAIARAGGVVVSGLAVGIDGAAHAAAVAEAAPTVAVLGGGHERLFPRAHGRLADLVVDEGGAVVSEVGPDVEPKRWSFPRRNRVISGLAEATVVVEAGLMSGALITASDALEQGRACHLVPGPLDAPTSAGCLAFLRDYPGVARVVAGIPELLEDLELVASARGPSGRGRRGAGPARAEAATLLGAGLGRVEAAVATALVAGVSTVDELAASVTEPVATILGALTLLEMRGLVASAYGRYRPAGRLASGGLGTNRRRVPPRGLAPLRAAQDHPPG